MTKIRKVLFLGSKSIGLKCLTAIFSMDPNSLIGVITFDDRNDPRSVHDKFREYTTKTHLKLFVVRNRKESEELIRQLKPELCIVVGWYWLIGSETLGAVPNGFIGIHNSLLPEYRGGSPLVWAVINGDVKVGVSLFSLTEGMDEGDIWGQRVVRIEFTDYISGILKKVEAEAISLFEEKYNAILNRAVEPTPQDHVRATYCTQRFPADGLINWQKSAVQIYNFIRAQSEPYPGAFTFYNGHKLTIWRAHPLDVTYYGTPGRVARITEQGVYVVCGDQKPIVLQEVQFGSGPKKRGNEVLRSIKMRFSSLASASTLPKEREVRAKSCTT